MTMEANGQSGNLPVNSDKKVFRIMVENEARFMQYLVLLGGMATIVGISILLTRRLKSR
jgi:nitrate reductase gamma subunit